MTKRGDGRILWRGEHPYVAYYAPIHGRKREVRESVTRALGRPATQADAEAFLSKRLREVANERDGVRRFVGPRADRILVGQLLDDVLADYELRKRKSTRTARSHVKPLREALEGTRAASVTQTVIARYVKGRRAEGRSDTTIDRELELLRHAFRLAKTNEVLAFVPAIPRLTTPHANARQGFLAPEQFDAVLAGIKNPDLRDFLEWFYWTGMRPGEIAALRWESYSQKAGELRLRAADAKTGRARVVPIIEDLAPILERRRARRVPSCPLIFHSHGKTLAKPTGGLHRWFYTSWKNACTAAGLPGLIPYDLRRTAVRNLLAIGIHETVVMAITGHRTRATFDRYAITATSDVADAFRRLGAARRAVVVSIDSRPKTRPGGAT